jgi:hypothetical protein
MMLRSVVLMTALALAAGGSSALAEPDANAVLLRGDPLVMRLSKDEFRIVFGLEARTCMPVGCKGSVRYRVDWRANDGTARSELRQVSYTVSPDSARTIAVDRQFLDTAEGAHTVDVLKVSVDGISRD